MINLKLGILSTVSNAACTCPKSRTMSKFLHTATNIIGYIKQSIFINNESANITACCNNIFSCNIACECAVSRSVNTHNNVSAFIIYGKNMRLLNQSEWINNDLTSIITGNLKISTSNIRRDNIITRNFSCKTKTFL